MSSIIGVAQLNKYIALRLKNDARLSGLTVRGEITDFKVHFRSGHAYFTMKEDGSQIKCVMFKNQLARNGFVPENGMTVLCVGNIEVYEPSGAYQIIASEIVPMGIGTQFLKTEAIKEKLTKMGLFSAERKKALPPLPKRIAVVTSASGAALHDVMNILGRRYPVGEMFLFPAQVQGETAHLSIVKALEQADRSGADVIILTRGGGSYEDLMPFNTEEVALAVARCGTPVISAVGHETDTTLADHAADVRAPTPSAAAELCAPDREQLTETLRYFDDRLLSAFSAYLGKAAACTEALERRLYALSPLGRLGREGECIEKLTLRMNAAFSRITEREDRWLSRTEERRTRAYAGYVASEHSRIERLSAELEAMDPYSVLERGYTITMKNGIPVTNTDQLSDGDEITIRFRDRVITALVKDTAGETG